MGLRSQGGNPMPQKSGPGIKKPPLRKEQHPRSSKPGGYLEVVVQY